MNVALISIGDEILTGFIVNTNAAYLGRRLTETGLVVTAIETIADEAGAIVASLSRYCGKADWVIVTGGLGPTSDDITKATVANYFGTELVVSEPVLQEIQSRFAAMNRPLTAANRAQADVPASAVILPNPKGTAPGMLLEKSGTRFVFLPGVPYEMQPMIETSVLPRMLETMAGEPRVNYRVLRTVEIAESTLFERVEGFLTHFPHCSLAFLPQKTGVQVRIGATAPSHEAAQAQLDVAEAFLTPLMGPCFIGKGDVTLEGLVAAELIKRQQTLAVAESCTGGLISHMLTNVPGSSAWFNRGLVTYANEAKMALLDVPADLLSVHGAVSEEVARAMAVGVRENAGSDWGLSVTGIAGPGGGSEEKPVGLVYIGLAYEGGCDVQQRRFYIDRQVNKNRFAHAALNMLRLALLK